MKKFTEGIINESTKIRMDELDEQRKELKEALIASKLRIDLGLKKRTKSIFSASVCQYGLY